MGRVGWGTRLAGGLAVLFAVGCAPDVAPQLPRQPVEKSLLWIGQAYMRSFDFDKPPKSDAPVRASLAEILQERGVRDLTVDDVLVSPRDGMPFVIRFGTKIETSGSRTILAHEQHGQNGRRFVLTAALVIAELGQDEFERDLAGKGPRPPDPATSL